MSKGETEWGSIALLQYKLQRLLLPAASPLRRWWPWEPHQRTSPPSTRPYTGSSGKLFIYDTGILQKKILSRFLSLLKRKIFQWTTVSLHFHTGSFFSFLKFVMSTGTYNSVHSMCNACTVKRFLLCEMLVEKKVFSLCHDSKKNIPCVCKARTEKGPFS